MGKVLFIDFDGTLHDSDAKYTAGLEGLFGLSGAEMWQTYLAVHRETVHRHYPGRHDDLLFHLRLLFDYLKHPYEEDVFRRVAAAFQRAQEECWTKPLFFPDSLPFLNEVKDRGHSLCLATGNYAAEKAQAVERAGGREYFDYAFDQTHLGVKGEAVFFLKALKATASPAWEAVAIGDSLPHDIKAAKEVGMAAVWVNRKGIPLPPTSPRPDHEVKDLLEALPYL